MRRYDSVLFSCIALHAFLFDLTVYESICTVFILYFRLWTVG